MYLEGISLRKLEINILILGGQYRMKPEGKKVHIDAYALVISFPVLKRYASIPDANIEIYRRRFAKHLEEDGVSIEDVKGVLKIFDLGLLYAEKVSGATYNIVNGRLYMYLTFIFDDFEKMHKFMYEI